MVALVGVLGLAAGVAPAAHAAAASIAIIADNPPPPPVPTGAPSRYTINFTCSAVVGDTCGPNPTIYVPLALTSSNPATPDPLTWTYSASSSIPGLIKSTSKVDQHGVIELNESALHPGDSDTIQVTVTPPNNITPDGTSWVIAPTFQTDAIPTVTVPQPAIGAASAEAKLSVSKVTNDGGAVYVVGNNVIFKVSARCNAGGATGNLYLQDGSLVDTLPAGLTFVSATPAPTSVSGGTITWSYPTAASVPSGCSASAGGSTSYTVTAMLPTGTANNTKLTNDVTFSGTPIGTSTPASTSADRSITAISSSPNDAGAFLSKSAKGPLSIPGDGYDATYAGNWITPINHTPSSNPGSAEGEYTVNVSYPASRAFETDLADPVPCLDSVSGVVYPSNTPSGQINGPSSINNLCQHPAFDPTVIQVNSASLGLALTATPAFVPIGIKPDGTTFPLTLVGSPGATSAYFDVPAADIGQVGAIELPQNASLTDTSMSMNVWGYGDASLPAGSDLQNIATATAYPTSPAFGSAPSTASQEADLYIEPNEPQLGVFKSFGSLGGAPGGTTALNLQANLSTPAPVSGNVVLTDLLPYGLSWHNPVTSASFSVTSASGGASRSATGTVEDIQNFASTGRELIRVTLPASAFTSGFYTITPPVNFVELNVPSAAMTYNNTDQLFVQGISDNTSPSCGPGTTSTPSTFESSDPLDLDNDGANNENYCQWAASLTVPPSGPPAFELVKTVQGDQDSGPKYSPGIGDASQGGSGVFTLTWSDTGGTALANPVIYDILPYIGDTGVSQNEATTPRDSQFATPFAGISGPLPPNVTVAYSESTNPCRPEVYPSASNPTCVNDWTTIPPSDLSLVKALRFTSTGTYQPAQSFSVAFTVDVPPQYVNTVAWNTAATDASTTGGTALLPAEPPKVGITAPAFPLQPTLSSTISAPDVQPGTAFSDTTMVANTGGASGTLAWTLVGPVAPAGNGTCAGINWSNASTVDEGTIDVAGDGAYTTWTSAPTGAGCYSYVDTLTGSAWLGTATSAAGAPGETVLVHAATLVTTASAVRILPGGTVTDRIALGGTGTGNGTLDWQLVGPITPAPDGTCNGLNWSSPATADSGTITVTGDGTYTTPASHPTATGCYSYAELLTAGSVGGPSTISPGSAGETVLVAQPSLQTSVSSASVLTGGSVIDSINIVGTGGQSGSVAWQLLGPIAPAPGGGCAGLDWSAAPTADQGTIAITGDGDYQTPAATLPAAGCYSYAATLTGAAYGAPVTSRAGAAGEVSQANSPPAARVTIQKRVRHKQVQIGASLTYTLTVSNAGPDTATGVTVTDAPSPKMRLVSAKAKNGTCDHKLPLTCQLDPLPAGGHETITVVAVPLKAGQVVNDAHVTIKEANSAPAHEVLASASAEVLVALRLTKTAAAESVRAGGHLRYTILVSNPSGVQVRNATICDRLPAGLVLASATAKTHLRAGRFCWMIASINRHARKPYTLTVRALPGATGDLVNTASITGPAIDPARARASVRVLPRPAPPTAVTG